MPYEEAIRVPLIVRADAIVGETRTDDHLVANIDLAPTIAAAAGVELPRADGRSLLPLLEDRAEAWRGALLIEHMRGTNPVPTYCALRTTRYLFVSYETGERELYDLDVDPYQLQNLTGGDPGIEARLGTTLRSLCDPPPPGYRTPTSVAATLLGLAAVIVFVAVSRLLFGRRRAVEG